MAEDKDVVVEVEEGGVAEVKGHAHKVVQDVRDHILDFLLVLDRDAPLVDLAHSRPRRQRLRLKQKMFP